MRKSHDIRWVIIQVEQFQLIFISHIYCNIARTSIDIHSPSPKTLNFELLNEFFNPIISFSQKYLD